MNNASPTASQLKRRQSSHRKFKALMFTQQKLREKKEKLEKEVIRVTETQQKMNEAQVALIQSAGKNYSKLGYSNPVEAIDSFDTL